MRILFDTNIILDIALRRQPHFENARKIFKMMDQRIIVGHITATTISDIYYLMRKEKGSTTTLEFISDLIEVVEIIGVDKNTILKALNSDLDDFEDAIQLMAATDHGLESIITRNTSDFSSSNLSIFHPKDFIDKYYS